MEKFGKGRLPSAKDDYEAKVEAEEQAKAKALAKQKTKRVTLAGSQKVGEKPKKKNNG